MNISNDIFKRRDIDEAEITTDQLRAYESPIKKFYYTKCGYNENELTEMVVAQIARHKMSQYDHDTYPEPPKGVAIIGNVGTGKTMLLKLAAKYLNSNGYISVPDLAINFSKHGATGFWSKIESCTTMRDFMLDDIGAEQNAKSYGNTVPVCELIYDRYNMWQNYGTKLWVSSNLKSNELAERYGDRVVDRIKEMCVVIPAVGESFR